RVLYGMYDLGVASNRPYKKSARIVGEVLGKYHPHGDAAVYETMVRMVQDFSLRYPLIDGQGNFGSVDGDAPAAMRYTEVRLGRIAEEMLRDIEKNTVDFVPNFDDTLTEPSVLPAMLPNLLVNGSSGIAVGMATNIPPHNLNEVIDGTIALIENPSLDWKRLIKYIKAPDFPTGGIIYGYGGVLEAYETGRGRIVVRARATIETARSDRTRIVVTEIPYQINKSALIERVADLVREKKIEDISDIRDESDRDGLRIVIELKRDATPEVVLNNLYKHTQMQTTFGVNMLALVNGVPKVLPLKEMMQPFIDYRHDVVVRRTKFELEEAEKRAHILEGYKIALDNIDAIIRLIKKSKDPETAKTGLMGRFKLSDVQAKAILDMRLQKLTGLERQKVEDEYKETIKLIEILKGILANKTRRMEIIKDELLEVKKKYGDDRRTEVVKQAEEFSIEDLIAEEDVVITISHGGFIKRYPVSGYRRQGRGGRGVTAVAAREDDFVEHMFIASTRDHLLFFTDAGRCYWLRVHEIPEAGRMSRGRSIVNLIQKPAEENITAFLNVPEFDDDHYVVMVTEKGLIKKTVLSEYGNPRRMGITGINLRKGDRLIDVKLTEGTQHIVIGTRNGVAIRFHEKEARKMGRTATGVRAIRLEKGDKVVGAVVLRKSGTSLLVATEHGYGKRSDVRDYRLSHRGGKGIITVKITDKTGKMVAIKEVTDNDDVVILTEQGMIIRQHASDIREAGRNTQGVRLIRLEPGDTVADAAPVLAEQNEEAKLKEVEEKSRSKGHRKQPGEPGSPTSTRKDGENGSSGSDGEEKGPQKRKRRG
ncbi:MAG TPA: DNA gyrase subunit A, partial [Bacteroidota bacterium]